MKFLLDTHIWMWSVDDPDRIRPAIRELVEDGQHELCISAISFWEIMLLSRRERIDIGRDPRRWIQFALHEYPIREVPIDRAIALESRSFDLPHQDPADRFIVATARVNDLVLLTHDRALIESPAVPTLGP